MPFTLTLGINRAELLPRHAGERLDRVAVAGDQIDKEVSVGLLGGQRSHIRLIASIEMSSGLRAKLVGSHWPALPQYAAQRSISARRMLK